MKTYRVVGTSTVDVSGPHPPGSEFTADIVPDTERFLIQIGAIVEVAPVIPDVIVPEPDLTVVPSRRLHRKKEEE